MEHYGRFWNERPEDIRGELYLVAGPATPVLSVEDAKAHMRIDYSDDDTLIEALIGAATQHVDGRDGTLRRALIDQTWELRLENLSCWNRRITIPLPPLIEVVSFKYIGLNSVEATFDSADYHVLGAGDRGRINLRYQQSWPVLAVGWPQPVSIRFRAGYVITGNSPSGEVPAGIVAAIKLIVAHLYENRDSVVIGSSLSAIELPQGVDWLLSPYRVYD